MLQKFQVFGIRHHGPGSSERLLRALEELQPDCLVVEAPADAENAIKYMGYEELVPPVALLTYNPKNLQEASYFPFASFSPEWQAIQYAIRSDITIKFMDLPMGMQYTLQEWEREERQLSFRTEGPTIDPALQRDPLGYMAKLAGYEDRERWWEATFEQITDDQDVFSTITDLIRTLRNDSGRKESDENLRREAYMRKVLRTVTKGEYEKVAVVCGAWHTPALVDLPKYKATRDNALLKGIKKKKIKTTWIPWSYNRLAFSSGYGAGVLSPAWYDLLFNHKDQAVTYWMIEVARLFREQDFNASSAHVLEAVRLADTLAAIRGVVVPGQAEIEEAALAVFGEGDATRLDFIRDRLVVGDKVGKVPPDIPSIPFLDDLLKQIKSCRLSKYWESTKVEYLKGTSTNPRGGIDLRESKDLDKSHLLHRLSLLGIPWGQVREANANATGSFKEIWRMEWQPEFSIRFIEVGIWGNTVRDAAVAFVGQEAGDTESLSEVATYIGQVLKADLVELIDPLISRLQALAAMTQDVFYLMDSLPALVDITQYGDARKTNVSAVYDLIDEIIPRVCIGLSTAAVGIDDEFSKELFQKLLAVNQRIGLINKQGHIEQWNQALRQLADNAKAVPLIRGISTRILFDKSAMDIQGTTNRLYFALSSSSHALEVANWLEGFLHGSGLVLIYHPALWEMLDGWVDTLTPEAFQEVLPVLRRTFSNFPGPERTKMLHLARQGIDHITTAENKEMNADRAELVWPTLQLLLGID
ncbi:MAG: hypothetical protein HRU41_28335 [Saprospiraceae bacterium]|nr:hypothetical protein [Saprospiraceae bacterium]